MQKIEYRTDEKQYIRAIENAYTYASQTLLDLVLREEDLIGRLKSVKHYFLLDQGDLIVTFLALCEKELNKDVDDVIKGRLESLLDLALRLSSAVTDPYKEDLRTELLPYDLQLQMCKILSIQTSEEQGVVLNVSVVYRVSNIQCKHRLWNKIIKTRRALCTKILGLVDFSF